MILRAAIDSAADELGLPPEGNLSTLSDEHLLVTWALLELNVQGASGGWLHVALHRLEREAEARGMCLKWVVRLGSLHAQGRPDLLFLLPFETIPYQLPLARRYGLIDPILPSRALFEFAPFLTT